MKLRTGDEPIPGYRLEEFLGKGQFGEVWKARSPGKAFAALKFLDLSGKQGRKEFRAIQRVKEIRHAHLMPITALWLLDDDGNVLNDQAMEEIGDESTLVANTLAIGDVPSEKTKPSLLVVAQLLGDKTLGDRLQECINEGQTGIPVAELITYMEEAAKGIDYLNSEHDLGSGIIAIQHCDIKPANILLTGDSVLICDFGVAYALAESNRDTRATGMVGSPAYMAPECIAQQPSSGSDQYSLAVTYFELRTGTLPFSKTTFADVIDAHRTGKLELTKLPPAERKVIEKATAVDPKKRYRSTTEMVRALRHAALGEKERPFHKRPAAMLISALLLFGCLLGGYLVRSGVGDGPAATRSFRVSLEPLAGELVINDQVQTLDADGAIELTLPSTDTIKIAASYPPEYDGFQGTVAVADIGEDGVQVRLAPSAEFQVNESLRLLEQGSYDDAVNHWARAVEYDKNGEFRTTPSPTARRTVDADGPLQLAAASPGRAWAGTVTPNGVLQLWRLDQPATAEPLRPLNDVTNSDPGKLAMSDRWAVVSYLNGEIRVVDLTQNPPQQEFTLHVKQNGDSANVPLPEIIEVGISPDQRWLVTASAAEDAIGATVIHRWDLQSDSPATTKTLIGHHEDAVPALAVDSRSQRVITVSWDQSVRSWPLAPDAGPAEGTLVASFSDEVNLLVVGTSVMAFAGSGGMVDPAGVTDTSGQHRIALCRNGGKCHSLPVGHSSPVEILALSQTEKWLVSGCEDLRDAEIHAWNLAGDLSSPIVLRAGHRGVARSICFSPDEQWMATGGDDGQVLLWDFQDLQQPGPLRLKTSPGKIVMVTIDASGRWLVSLGTQGLWIWDLTRCTLVKRGCDKARIAPAPPEESTSPLLDA